MMTAAQTIPFTVFCGMRRYRVTATYGQLPELFSRYVYADNLSQAQQRAAMQFPRASLVTIETH